MFSLSRPFRVFVITLAGAGFLHAQDVVILSRPTGARNIRLEGTIVDFTGEHLVIQIRGRDDKYPADRVVSIQTTRSQALLDGKAALTERRWSDALTLLHRAASEDPRTWMRRQILADISLCYLNTGDIVSAVENFANVYQSDPTTRDFPQIPLAWGGERVDANTAAMAARWLNSQQPVKQLMGASWLLNAQTDSSVAALQTLLDAKDARVAQLAQAQAWRTRVVLADEAEVRRWERRLRSFPPELRYGPSTVIGRALHRLQHYEDAATALMRAPIEKPQLAPLASEALLAAGAALEKLGQPQNAQRLYSELLSKYPTTDAATLAKNRLASDP